MLPVAGSGSPRVDLRVLSRACAVLSRRDPDLASIVRRFGEPPLWPRRPGFATLVLIILEQQVTLASGRAAFERLERVAGGVTPERIAYLSEASLRRRAGLTRQKASYCHTLAEEVAEKRLRLGNLARASDQEVRERLCRVRGIGPWSADVYLLFALRRPDIWPPGDLALIKAMREVKRLPADPTRECAQTISDTWQPWRSVAARLLWHFYLSSRGRDVPAASSAR